MFRSNSLFLSWMTAVESSFRQTTRHHIPKGIYLPPPWQHEMSHGEKNVQKHKPRSAVLLLLLLLLLLLFTKSWTARVAKQLELRWKTKLDKHFGSKFRVKRQMWEYCYKNPQQDALVKLVPVPPPYTCMGVERELILPLGQTYQILWYSSLHLQLN
jgi:hypothetical protein